MRKLCPMLLIILLAACGGPQSVIPQQVANTPEPPTVEPTTEAAVGVQPTTLMDELMNDLPPAGTPLLPVTEEASADPLQVPFTSIIYEESGGIADGTLYIEIYHDGRVVRDGVETHISATQVDAITQALSDSQFFGISGQFALPGAGTDQYEYAVTVELDNGTAKRIDAQDNLTPPQLKQLFSLLRTMGT